MTSSTPSVSLWVKSEPFVYGVFQVHPHPRLALHNIKKLVTYAKNKGKSGFPKLSYPVWKYIACNKLSISEDLAWTLFQTCIIMSASHMYKLKELELKLNNCKTEDETEQVKNVQSTELFRFVLFLYIQQINKISLRASVVSANAEWPGFASKSNDFDSGRSTPNRPCKNIDEQNHLQFISENLMEILDLLVEPDSYGLGGSDTNLSTEAVEALSFLLEGTSDRFKTVKSFNEIAHLPPLITRTGYSKISRTFSVRGLHSWIRSCLASNPFSVEVCVNTGKRLHWPFPGGDSGIDLGSQTGGANPGTSSAISKRQRIATTANLLPKEAGKGNKLVIMSLVAHQTVARSSGTLQDSTVRLHRCHYSYIYLLSPLRSASIEKCRKLTLVLGPVENTLHLNQCEECIVIAPARRVVVTGCKRCTLYLLTPTRPLLVGPPGAGGGVQTGGSSGSVGAGGGGGVTSGVAGGYNEDIILAPYHTHYPKLGEHLARAGLDTEVNCWDQPIVLGGDQKHDQPVCWDLLQPRDFYPFTIPLEMEGATTECPYPLPHLYQSALNERESAFTNWMQLIKDMDLTSDQRRTLRTLVEQRFKTWLTDSSNQRQLNLLDPTNPTNLIGQTSSNNSTAPSGPGSMQRSTTLK